MLAKMLICFKFACGTNVLHHVEINVLHHVEINVLTHVEINANPHPPPHPSSRAGVGRVGWGGGVGPLGMEGWGLEFCISCCA